MPDNAWKSPLRTATIAANLATPSVIASPNPYDLLSDNIGARTRSNTAASSTAGIATKVTAVTVINNKPDETEDPEDPEDPEDSDSDYDSDSDSDSSMGETTTKSVKTILLGRDRLALTPIQAPNKLQVIQFTRHLIHALMQCPGANHIDGGHVYLILDEQQFKHKISDEAIYTIKPEVPPRDPTTATSKTLNREISRQEKALYLHTEYDTQTINLLVTKFPNGPIGLLDSDGELPWTTTAKALLDHISGELHNTKAVNDSYLQLVRDTFAHKHTMSAAGANEYFQTIENKQTMIEQLGHTQIPYELIIASAQEAFQQSGYDLKDVLSLESKWEIIKADKDYAMDTKITYTAFKKHYNKGLSLLYVHHNTSKRKGSAHYSNMENESDDEDDWKSTVQQNYEGIDELKRAFNAMSAQDSIPGMIPIPNTSIAGPAASNSTITPDKGHDYMKNWVMNAIKDANTEANGGHRTSTKPTKKVFDWRQFTKFCWSCGVNLHHDSPGCDQKKKAGHITTATYANPQDGNTSRNRLWQQWCTPVTNIVVPTKGN